jgi:hypothetical protein
MTILFGAVVRLWVSDGPTKKKPALDGLWGQSVTLVLGTRDEMLISPRTHPYDPCAFRPTR